LDYSYLVFYIIRHRTLRKVSFYFYGGKELNETGGSRFVLQVRRLNQPNSVLGFESG